MVVFLSFLGALAFVLLILSICVRIGNRVQGNALFNEVEDGLSLLLADRLPVGYTLHRTALMKAMQEMSRSGYSGDALTRQLADRVLRNPLEFIEGLLQAFESQASKIFDMIAKPLSSGLPSGASLKRDECERALVALMTQATSPEDLLVHFRLQIELNPSKFIHGLPVIKLEFSNKEHSGHSEIYQSCAPQRNQRSELRR